MPMTKVRLTMEEPLGVNAKHSVRLARFLESRLPIRAIAHLTSPTPRTAQRLDVAFRDWILEVQKGAGFTVGWVRADEFAPQRHIHAALIAARPIDCHLAARVWQSKVGTGYQDAAIVEPYKNDSGGLAYIFKKLDTDGEDVQFSENLAAFGRLNAPRGSGMNSRQWRQCRRIQNQMGDRMDSK
jgi:hypothetical protein